MKLTSFAFVLAENYSSEELEARRQFVATTGTNILKMNAREGDHL